MEEDITDAIYGDLEDFEFEEKLKKRNEEITSLTDRLNQSVVTITDLQNQIRILKKENRQLEKNSSSLLLTAKVEVNRKQRDIAALNERIDNRTFRRPNRNAVAIQTDLTIPPLVNVNVNNNNVTLTELMNEKVVETCTEMNIETVEKTNPTNNNRNGSTTYRIPKKNPFARNMDIDESKNSVCNTVKPENSQIIPNDQQKRYHVPKKNPHARRLDIHEEKPDGNKGIRYENDVEKGRSSRRDGGRDNRKRSTSSRNRDSKKSCSSDDQKRYRHNSRSRRKHSRGRSSSDERDRHSKRFRSNSKPNRHRSRSTSYNEEKHRQPKKNCSKSRKDDKSEETISQHQSMSSMKEKDLEAMLIEQKKILEEIDSQDNKGEILKESMPKERRKQKLSTNEVASGKIMNPERSDDTFNSANEAISNVPVPLISESKDSPSMVEKNSVADVNHINKVESVPEITIPLSCRNEVSEPVALFPIIKLKSLTPLKNVSSPAKELVDKKDEVIIPPKTIQFECNENSNSQMDIDYELMERTSAVSQINLTSQETNKDLEEHDCKTTTSPSKEKCSDSLFAELSASIIAVDGNVTGDGDNILNRSSERHIVSKSCEYTVQDVGDEVVIFLTKKRKKNKKLKPVS